MSTAESFFAPAARGRPMLPAGRVKPARRSRLRSNLPAPSSSFVGRYPEIAEAVAMLRTGRLVTLTGTGGVGKTRLALEVARVVASRYDDGAWFVELASVGDGDLVADSVLAALPHTIAPGNGPVDLVEVLRSSEALLVLDNCEHVVASCATLVERLVHACPDLSVLATSRQPLGVAGERSWPLAPLSLPDAGEVDAKALAATEAVQLFVERAHAACPGFRLDTKTAPAVAEICRRVDGLPLAIELAAAQLAVLAPTEIVAPLDDRFRLLEGQVGNPRHQTLRAAFDWSHDLLEAREAAMLRRLAVFSGGWSLAAAEEVCSQGIERRDVLDLMAALVGKSLIVAEQHANATRFHMLESIRHFALEKLGEAGEGDALRLAHAEWCVQRAAQADRERRGRRQEAWLEALDQDQDNFRAALWWARSDGREDLVLALAADLAWFWESRGQLREGLEWLDWVISQKGGAPELRAKAMRGAGMLRWLLGDVASGLPLVDKSVELFRRAGNAKESAGCVCTAAVHLCGGPAHTIPMLRDHVERMRKAGDADRLAHALNNCGTAYFFAGEATRARACFDECLALPAGSVDPDTVTGALLGLGRVAMLLGDLDRAEAALRQGLVRAVRCSDRDSRSVAMCWLGDLARVRGDYERARLLISDAMELVRGGGPALSVARCTQFQARVELSLGSTAVARELYLESLHAAGAADMPYHRVRSLQGVGEAAASAGRLGEAEAAFDEALEVARANGDVQAVGRALSGLSSVAAAGRLFERSTKLRIEAIEIQERVGDLLGLLSSLEAQASLALSAGRHEMAARLLAAAGASRSACGAARTRAEERQVERCLNRARIALGPEAFSEATEHGARLTAAEAASYGSRGRGTRSRPSSGWDSLSRAERDITKLVTQGLTNQEIAERLFMARRTVSTHLTHIYRKVGVGSRRELAREAARA